jgi:hypothetical protein
VSVATGVTVGVSVAIGSVKVGVGRTIVNVGVGGTIVSVGVAVTVAVTVGVAVGVAVRVGVGSTWQIDEQPSPFVVLPSSHVSLNGDPDWTMPSPQ